MQCACVRVCERLVVCCLFAPGVIGRFVMVISTLVLMLPRARFNKVWSDHSPVGVGRHIKRERLSGVYFSLSSFSYTASAFLTVLLAGAGRHAFLMLRTVNNELLCSLVWKYVIYLIKHRLIQFFTILTKVIV